MPKDHARKKALAKYKTVLGIKHADAVALLDHDDYDERMLMCGYLSEYEDINTYPEALAYLKRQQELAAPLCDKCGWTVSMVCPECPGCGCYNGRCSGWRHHEYDDDPESDVNPFYGCTECGAGGGSDPYGECQCYEFEDDSEDQELEGAPA